MRALAGTLEPETARKAFVQAAMVAEIYVKEGDGRGEPKQDTPRCSIPRRVRCGSPELN